VGSVFSGEFGGLLLGSSRAGGWGELCIYTSSVWYRKIVCFLKSQLFPEKKGVGWMVFGSCDAIGLADSEDALLMRSRRMGSSDAGSLSWSRMSEDAHMGPNKNCSHQRGTKTKIVRIAENEQADSFHRSMSKPALYRPTPTRIVHRSCQPTSHPWPDPPFLSYTSSLA